MKILFSPGYGAGSFRIEEYDGFETIIPMRDVLWYDPMGDDLV